jgi:adenylate kinase
VNDKRRERDEDLNDDVNERSALNRDSSLAAAI